MRRTSAGVNQRVNAASRTVCRAGVPSENRMSVPKAS